jgi:hypothetical protein
MRSTRSILIAAVAAASLLAPASAMAGDPAPNQDLPPAFVPPAPTPVTDVATAEAFTTQYATNNASRFLNSDRRRTRVTDVQARCLEHPVIADRFGCIFTLRAAVWERSRWGHSARLKRHGNPHPQSQPRRIRVRNFGCLGALSITGGPTVTPSATLRFVECARVPRGDYLAPEPVV